jgi:hypothetical protein
MNKQKLLTERKYKGKRNRSYQNSHGGEQKKWYIHNKILPELTIECSKRKDVEKKITRR